MVMAIFLLLAWLAFCIIMLFRPLPVSRRQRLSPLAGIEDQGEWSSVREPRRSTPPHWPPRAAAAIPEDSKRQEPSNPVEYSDTPQEPLRLEDGLA